MKVELFFVLNGLLNGERGVSAIPTGGGDDPVLADGWYWSLEGMDDGEGPYYNREDAKEAGEQDLTRYEEIARGGIERNLGDVAAVDDPLADADAVDAIYDEAYTLALDSLVDNPLSKSCPLETAKLIAQEQAQLVAQP